MEIQTMKAEYIHIYAHTHTHTHIYNGLTPHSMQDLSSQIRDLTHAPCSGSRES